MSDVLELAKKSGAFIDQIVDLDNWRGKKERTTFKDKAQLQTFVDLVTADLHRELAGLQALLKDKDEALGIAKDYVVNAAAEIHESLAGYLPHKHEAVDEDVLTVKQALAQTSGTDVLDKMLEAERVKVWNEFADMEPVAVLIVPTVTAYWSLEKELAFHTPIDKKDWLTTPLIPRPERKP